MRVSSQLNVWTRGTTKAAAVKSTFFAETPMEAERLNAIANRLQDLQERTEGLRRYL
jgi:hypothetical protein